MLPKIWPVTCHTDQVGPGSTFVAIAGKHEHGISYLAQAIELGATKIVIALGTILSPEILAKILELKIELLEVSNCRQALSNLSAAAWGYPAKKLKIIAVTGTKGKTTSVYSLKHLLSSAGYKTAMLTGVHNIIDHISYDAPLTTPHPDYLQMFFAQCVSQNIEYVVMEAAAQAFSLHRLDDVKFSAAIFTNLEQEHAEFYSAIDQYFAAKCQIFKHMQFQAPIIFNHDNSWCVKALEIARNLNLNCKTFSFNNSSSTNYLVELQQDGAAGLVFNFTCAELQKSAPNPAHPDRVRHSCKRRLEQQSMGGIYKNTSFIVPKLWGKFNCANLAGVIACLDSLGLDLAQIKQNCLTLQPAPGRSERYELPNGASAIIDYAHTPSSFEALLSLLRSITKHLIVVFGASGDRDKLKRPLMGKIAAQFADQVIITTDNPRTEDAQLIAQAVYAGVLPVDLTKVLLEPDRAQAIALAVKLSQPGSMIAILGKGPDEYQIFGREKIFFSDRQEVLKSANLN
jgi:UDP-N-acetylmuramoyl-L-alanyl-D-glutamate--2,6-diaminopimelate ligase